jgi:hypothetical protein
MPTKDSPSHAATMSRCPSPFRSARWTSRGSDPMGSVVFAPKPGCAIAGPAKASAPRRSAMRFKGSLLWQDDALARDRVGGLFESKPDDSRREAA